MVFTSNLFLFLFLPIFLAIYYLIPFRLRSALILVFSYVFYGWWRPDFAILLGSVTLGTYIFTLAMEHKRWQTHRFSVLTLGVALNLSALAYFKYFNFGVESLNSLLTWIGLSPLDFAKVVLPIGLSFFVFHAISYMVDVYRKEAPAAKN